LQYIVRYSEKAVPWKWWLAVSLFPRGPVSIPAQSIWGLVSTVLDEAALGQVFLRAREFLPISINQCSIFIFFLILPL
jgi:hypothetical protein